MSEYWKRIHLSLPTSYWNWKCALMSATVRSVVYLLAMARGGAQGRLSVVVIEVFYVTLTAGFYAGLQQKALSLRSRLAGDLAIVVGVPGLSQGFDWLVHRAMNHTAGTRATAVVCLFALVSALFHLFVMRRGVFLTGDGGRSLVEDFSRIPRLVAHFLVLLASMPWVLYRRLQTEVEVMRGVLTEPTS